MQHRSALALTLTLACATAQTPPPAAETASAPSTSRAAAEMRLPGCRVGPGDSITIRPDATLEEVVEITACTDRVERPAPEERWYVRRHHQFDEYATPALEVAAMILACVAEGSCDPQVDPESFGIIHAYAAKLPMKEVEQTILSHVPAMVGGAFIERLRSTVPKLTALARTLPEHPRDIFVDLPLRIRTDRLAERASVQAFEARAAEQLEENEGVLAGAPSADRLQELLRRTRKLRDDALVSCATKRSVRHCLDGPVIRPLTEHLVTLALEIRDTPQAAAELEQLRQGTDKSTYPIHLANELRRRVDTHTALVIRYEEAKKKGTLTPVMLEAVYGKPAPVRVAEPSWGDGGESFDLEEALAEVAETVKVHGIVRSSRGRAGALEIALDPCNGSEECRLTALKPVLLAVSEARLLKVGEKIEAFVERRTRRGVVLYAYRTRPSERLVQVRGTRLAR